ncbi:hypothetical protein HK099_006307 [Clydaea vesicula]|uniref:CAP-Gly domain-containing protein n=1 Tax=Clydaea vesicula TaxID=447962 RepID=A0AAD5TY33_9FUNG|nr:hypothetical protein HK099_006307 [Clydaea vesicula]
MSVGQRVSVNGVNGVIRFVGETSFQTGIWVGVELDSPNGKNDGSVKGERYFTCEPLFGMFVRHSQLKSEVVTSRSDSPTSTNSGRSSPSRPDIKRPSSRLSSSSSKPTTSTPKPTATKAPSSNVNKNQTTKKIISRQSNTAVTPGSTDMKSTARLSSVKNLKAKVSSPVSSPEQISPISASPLPSPSSGLANTLNVVSIEEVEVDRMELESPINVVQLDSVSENKAQEEILAIIENDRRLSLKGNSVISEPGILEADFDESKSLATPANTPAQEISEINFASNINSSATAASVQLEEKNKKTTLLESKYPPSVVFKETPLPSAASVVPLENAEVPKVRETASDILPIKGVPLKEYEDLKIKYKILESKREQDKLLLKDMEQLKQELEQTILIKTKLNEKFNLVQNELKDVQNQLKEAQVKNRIIDAQMSETNDILEMAALDREVAEERADALEAELEEVRYKLEEMELSVEILKQEKELNSENIDDGNVETSNGALIQLEKQNSRLKDALMMLREITIQEEEELKLKIELLTSEVAPAIELKAYVISTTVQNERLIVDLERAEKQVEEMKLSLDDALGASEMVEQLSENNLYLNEKLEELKAAVEDLETIKELNDELELNHIETEKQLEAEIDLKNTYLAEFSEKFKSQEEVLVDYERTIKQFRDLVNNLRNDLAKFSKPISAKELDFVVEENQNAKKRGGKKNKKNVLEEEKLRNPQQVILSLNMQLNTVTAKIKGKEVELELKKLEPYLPDTFFTSENDSILCLLFFERILFKAQLCKNRIEEIVNDHERQGRLREINSWSYFEVSQYLVAVTGAARKFFFYINVCDVDSFLRMQQVYKEVIALEKRLDSVVNMIVTNEMLFQIAIEELQTITTVLEIVAQNHLVKHQVAIPSNIAGATEYQHSPIPTDTTVQMVQSQNRAVSISLLEVIFVNIDRFVSELNRLEFFFEKSVDAGLYWDKGFYEVLEESEDDIGYGCGKEFLSAIKNILLKSAGIKTNANKLSKMLIDAEEENKIFSPIVNCKLLDALNSTVKFNDYIVKVNTGVKSFLEQDPLNIDELEALIEICAKFSEETWGTKETFCGERLLENSSLTENLLHNIVESSDEKEFEILADKPPYPWLIRSEHVKADYILNTEMQNSVRTLTEEINLLIKEMKIKDQSREDTALRLELLEKRMMNGEKQIGNISELREELQKSKQQEKTFTEAIENMSADIELLEKENHILKNQNKILESKSKQLDLNPPTATITKESLLQDDSYIGDSSEANVDVSKQDISDPLMRKAHKAAVKLMEPEHENSIIRTQNEVKLLNRQIHQQLASQSVVDLTKVPVSSKGWKSNKNDLSLQILAQKSEFEKLEAKVKEGKEKIREIGNQQIVFGWSNYTQGSKFSNEKKQNDIKVAKFEEPILIGRIKVSKDDIGGGAHEEKNNSFTFTSIREFANFHGIFAN